MGNLGKAAVLGIYAVITACGGGGPDDDSGPTPANQAPTVSAPATSVAESASVSITATATDTDGNIASYSWSQESGPELNLAGTDTASVTVTAPSVEKDVEAVLTITVTDDDGATAQADVTITITAQNLGFTVQGLVVDTAETDIEITVGSKHFSTKSDNNGAYSLELSFDESLAQAMVIASAKSSANNQLHYVSTLGEVGILDSSAGSDNILTVDENPAVNISAISTAISSQLRSINAGSISNQGQLESAAKMVDSEVALDVATAIQLALEFPDDPDLQMPSKSADTYAFANDLESSALHCLNVKSSNQSLWDSTQTAISNNSSLVFSHPPKSVDSVVDTYYFTTPETSLTGIFNGSRLILKPDGSGTMSARLDESSFDWTLGENGISFEGLELVSSEAHPWDSDLGKVVHEQTITHINNLRWISHHKLSDVLLLEIESYKHYPDGEYPDTMPAPSMTTGTAIKAAGKISAADIIKMGMDYSVPRPTTEGKVTNPVEGTHAYLDIQASRMSFSGNPTQGGSASVTVDSYDGDGTLVTSKESANWVIAADGSLQITYANGDSSNLVFLSENQETASVNLRTTQNSEVYTESGYLLLKEEPAWTALSAPGIYQYPLNFLSPIDQFWFEINDDGSALTVSTVDLDNNGTLEDSEYFIAPGLWQINGEGNLLVRRYRYNSGVATNTGYCTPASWAPADEDECVLFHEREWNLHQTDSSDGYWLNHHHRFFIDWDRENLPDPSVSGHIFLFGSIYNRIQYKTHARPLEIPPHLQP